LLEKNLEIKDGQENIKASPIETLRNTTQEYFEVNEAALIMRSAVPRSIGLSKAKSSKRRKSYHEQLSQRKTSNHFLLNNKLNCHEKEPSEEKGTSEAEAARTHKWQLRIVPRYLLERSA
jgi:hypothetical protein